MSAVALLIYVLVVILIFGAIVYAIRFFPLAEPFRTIAYVIVLIVFLLVMLSLLGVLPGPWPRFPVA